MSLLSSELYSALDGIVRHRGRRAADPTAEHADVEPTQTAMPEVARPRLRPDTYVLTHSDAGWTLLTRSGSERPPRWSTPLAQHGASPDAPVRVAQAVGVRVLHELGVDVTGWSAVPAPRREQRPDVIAHTAPAPRRR